MREDWTVKQVIEPQTGKTHRLYWYRGKRCKRVVLDTPMARQLAGYVLIEKDLRSAASWLSEIEKLRAPEVTLKGAQLSPDRTRYDLIKGLFVAALTFYGKAFSQCEGRRVKLERKQLEAEFCEAHDDAISFRHNFAAHSGGKLLEFAEVVVALPPKTKRSVLPNIYREMTQPDFGLYSSGSKTFRELVDHVHAIPLTKIAQLNTKILKEDVLAKGYDYWSSR
jgi:hypothetical protein